MAENAQDVEAATGKVSDALLQRLVLKHNKIQQLAGGCAAGEGRCLHRAACLLGQEPLPGWLLVAAEPSAPLVRSLAPPLQTAFVPSRSRRSRWGAC